MTSERVLSASVHLWSDLGSRVGLGLGVEDLVVDQARITEPDRQRRERRAVDDLELLERPPVGDRHVVDVRQRFAVEDVGHHSAEGVGGVLSAAVRLGITGSYDAQRLQAESAAWLASVQARYRDAEPRDLAQAAPLVDIFQGAHDRLYSRLFQS